MGIQSTKLGNKTIKHFDSRFFSVAGVDYELVGAGFHKDGKFYHDFKDPQGNYFTAEHNSLIQKIENQ